MFCYTGTSMDTITVNGVDYERASALAKKFKYTSDYIGQLCRSRKVDAQLVGRSWYVNPLSLKTHQGARYSKTNLDDKALEYKVEINKSRIDVLPEATVIKPKMTITPTQNFAKRIAWKPVKYDFDNSDLLPKLSDGARKINVDLAESLPVAIKTFSPEFKLEAEPMPVVSLSGNLNVTSLDEIYEVEDQKAISRPKLFNENIEKPKNYLTKSNSSTKLGKNRDLADMEPNDLAGVVSLTPRRVEDIRTITETQRLWKSILVFCVIALSVVVGLLLFVDVEVVVADANYQTSFNFSLDSFSSVLGKK